MQKLQGSINFIWIRTNNEILKSASVYLEVHLFNLSIISLINRPVFTVLLYINNRSNLKRFHVLLKEIDVR